MNWNDGKIKRLLLEFKPSSRTTNLFDPNIRETSTRYFVLTDKFGNKFRLFIFSERVTIETPIKTSLLFSVNLPDIVCLANKPLGVSLNGRKLFVANSDNRSVLDCVALIEPFIRDLGFEQSEGLFVYRNLIELVLDKNRNLVHELSILTQIKSIIEDRFPEDVSERSNESEIPNDFRDLLPLFKDWAIADDLERTEKIARSSNQELKTVIDAVFPRIDQINAYLDSFESSPFTHEATLLGKLAELVSDLMSSKEK